MDVHHWCAPQTLAYRRLRFLLTLSAEDMFMAMDAMLRGDEPGTGTLPHVDPLQRQIIANMSGLVDGAGFYALLATGTLGWSMFRNSAETTAGCTQVVCDQAAHALIGAVDEWLAAQVAEPDD
jgi:hypothetical protein